MALDPTLKRRLTLAGVAVFLVVGFASFAVVFLVLTGIIAEPETVIENILRTLLGQ
ncbi:MAG: hypothetical protein U1E29_17505 [Coriobacteriia bacterium]|nr:hypothetical protein [Coriobacteriia bacterium]